MSDDNKKTKDSFSHEDWDKEAAFNLKCESNEQIEKALTSIAATNNQEIMQKAMSTIKLMHAIEVTLEKKEVDQREVDCAIATLRAIVARSLTNEFVFTEEEQTDETQNKDFTWH